MERPWTPVGLVRLDGGGALHCELGYSPSANHHFVRYTPLRRGPAGTWEPDPGVGVWGRAPVGPADVAGCFGVSEHEAARWMQAARRPAPDPRDASPLGHA